LKTWLRTFIDHEMQRAGFYYYGSEDEKIDHDAVFRGQGH
jgi:hypothetical protein